MTSNSLQVDQNVPPRRDDSSRYGLSETHTSSQTDSAQGGCKNSRKVEEISSSICLRAALKENFAQGPQGKD